MPGVPQGGLKAVAVGMIRRKSVNGQSKLPTGGQQKWAV